MADLDRKPFWTQRKNWHPELETSIRKIRFRNSRRVESEVIPDDGTHGIEFFLALTYPQFAQAYIEQEWSQEQGYTQLTKVLNGTLKITWEEVLDSPDFADPLSRTDDRWDDAISQLICKFLNCRRPRDVQNRYHETQYSKTALEPTEGHFRRFKESMRHARLLPQGVKPDPSDEEAKEWYFRTFCKKHRSAFLSAGKNLDTCSMEVITEFMRLQQENELNDGTLREIAGRRRDTRSSRRSQLANGKYGRDKRDEKPYRSSSSYRESGSRRDRRRDQSPDRKSYRRGDSRSRHGRDDHRRSRNDRYDSRDNRREDRRDSRNGRDKNKPKLLRSDGQDCKLHAPCKHTWAECSKNPRNQRKNGSSRQHASHHQHDDSGDDVSVASDHSKGASSSCGSPSHRSDANSASDDASHGDDNFHLGCDSYSSDESRAPREVEYRRLKKGRVARKARKPKRKPSRTKRTAFLVDTSDEDELAGSE